MSEGNEEVCGESYDHDLRIVDERDGIVVYECRSCGAEVEEEDGEPYFAELELPVRDWLKGRHIDFVLREDAADSLVLALSPVVVALVTAAEERGAEEARRSCGCMDCEDTSIRLGLRDDARTTHATHAD